MNRSLLKLILFICFIFIVFFTAAEAQRDFENLLDSKEWQDMVSKGTVYLETGMYDKAMDYFKQVALTYPYLPEAQYYLGFVYYKGGDYSNAEKVFKRALALDKEYIPALYYLGLIYYDKEENEKAVGYFDDVTAYDPSFQSAYFNRGVAYVKMGRPVDAVREFAYALYLDPADEKTFEALVSIRGKASQKAVSGKNVVTAETEKVNGKNARAIENIISKATEMEVSVLNPGKEKLVLTENTKETEVISEKGEPGVLEINFIPPSDLSGKNIRFKVKGEKGKEKARVVIKDAKTRVCPKFRIGGITDSWTDIEINIDSEAGMYIDTGKVEKIRLEIEGTDASGSGEEARVFIGEISIK